MPTIGERNDKKTRGRRPDGFKTFLVRNKGDLEVLFMNNRTFAAEIASNVSSKQRAALVERALQLNIKVTNRHAKLRAQENE